MTGRIGVGGGIVYAFTSGTFVELASGKKMGYSAPTYLNLLKIRPPGRESLLESRLQEDAPRVLIADDEKVIREILSDFLTMEGLIVHSVENGQAAAAELEQRHYDIVISDLKMPGMGGLELLQRINEMNIDVLPVMMTGFGTVETAIEAMKMGAYDYVLKPFKVEEVVHIVHRGLERQRLQQENMRLKEALSLYRISEAISQSLSLDHVLELVISAAVEELRADVVTLLLPDDEGGVLCERIRRGQNTSSAEERDDLDLRELMHCHDLDIPVLARGAKALRFVSRPAGLSRVVSFVSVPLRERHRILGMINAYSYTQGRTFNEGQRRMLAVLGCRAAVTIENARLYENLLQSNRGLEVANRSLEENFRQTIVGFANAMEENDRYTRGHSERVAVYSRLIAEEMGLRDRDVEKIALAARIHDIGKIGIPTEKLNKRGKLTLEERAILRAHPEKGRRILEPVPFLSEMIPGAYCHHENFNGSGYPQGLAGNDIPLMGRVIAVADAYDAMTTDRAYRKAMPGREAIAELQRCNGDQFDPEVISAFMRALAKNPRVAGLGPQTSFDDLPITSESKDSPHEDAESTDTPAAGGDSHPAVAL